MRRTEEEFQKKAYRLYQLNWMQSHGFSIEDFFNKIKESIVSQVAEPYSINTELRAENAMECAYEEFDESGFGSGSLWACIDEFLGAEYLDSGYMKYLLSGSGESEDMMKDYYKYTGNMIEGQAGVKVETTAGTLRAYKNTVPDNPGITIMLQPKGYDDEIDVTQALVYETPEMQATANEYKDISAQDVEIVCWGDATTEDYTHAEVIRRSDIEEGLSTETPESQLN